MNPNDPNVIPLGVPGVDLAPATASETPMGAHDLYAADAPRVMLGQPEVPPMLVTAWGYKREVALVAVGVLIGFSLAKK
jgi:hypothetical protein|tara:strand:- start:650 stop:886 length:237 start_codon:yes stop_codon:yes gene_type:complete